METQAHPKIKLRIIAKTTIQRRFAVVRLGEKVAVAFGRDSGAVVARGSARMIEGEIGSGGSRANWYCFVREGSVFEIEADEEFYRKNKNRVENWELVEISAFSVSKERSNALLQMENNIG